MWAGAQREPRWMREAKAKAQRDREAAAAGRTDAKMKNVVVSEKWDKKVGRRGSFCSSSKIFHVLHRYVADDT